MTVNVLLSVGYCTVSSVAAPPRHPAPSISNTSVGARECGFAIRVVRVLVVVHVLVRESVRTCKFTCKKIYLTCTLSCHWCVRVKCSGAVTQWRATTKRAIIQVISEVVARTKRIGNNLVYRIKINFT